MRHYKSIVFIIISIIITDTFRILSADNALNVEYSTYISAFLIYISIIILIFLVIKNKWFTDTPKYIKALYIFWMIVIIVNIFRGFFVAKDYWDWKFLMLTSFAFSLIPLAFFLGNNLNHAKTIIKMVIKYIFPLGFMLIPLSLITTEELYPRIMIMVSLFVLFIPFVKRKWKLLIIIVSLVSLFIALGFRTNIIKISLSYLILGSYYFIGLNKKFRLNLFRLTLFAIPPLLIVSSIIFNFNIFNEFSRLKSYYITTNKGEVENLVVDTRTFLYVEVLSQLNFTDSYILGESAAGYYESKAFYNSGGAIMGKRYGSEVGILNIMLRYGLLGVISYFLMLYAVSYLSINNSNNDLSKLIGLFIASRWVISFFEEFTQFDINFLFFWMIIGLVSSTAFRKMNNEEIKNYLKL